MRGDMYKINVHVGTHSSGSGVFQQFLAANRRAILGAGFDIACPPSEDLTEAAVAKAAASGIGLAMTERGTGERRGLIVSDHAIGAQTDRLVKAQFYPEAADRARALRAAIGLAVDRLVVVVQSYEQLFANAWAQHSMANLTRPFADLVPQIYGFDGGWLDLVENLREGLEARHVTVLAAPQDPMAVLSHLSPDLRLSEVVRPEPAAPVTETAIAMAQRHLRAGGRFAPGQRARLMAFHARQPQLAAPSAFEGLRLADLRGRYVADLDSLSRMPGVQVLGGTMSSMAAE